MTKFRVPLFTYIILHFIVTCTIQSELGLDDIDTKNVFVEFNPLVSILDELDPERYDVNELLPLISKVTTRFTKLYIGIEYYLGIRGDKGKSQLRSPAAAAMYNCLNTTTQKIEVILGIHGRTACECAHVRELVEFAKNFSDGVNKKCAGAVTTILLEAKSSYDTCNPNNCSLEEQIFTGYRWGSLLKVTDYCDYKSYPYQLQNGSALVAFEYSNVADYFVLSNLTNCKSHVESPTPLSVNWKMIRFSNLDENRLVNMTYLISSWANVLKNSSFIHILSQAFDSYDVDQRSWVTNGWWYLLEDPRNKNTSNYIFEEKIKVAKKLDYERDPRNFQWLYKVGNFSQNSTGIIYTMKIPIDLLTIEFCQLLVVDQEIIKDLESSLYSSTNISLSACGSKTRVFILLSDLPNFYINSLNARSPTVVLVDRTGIRAATSNATFVEAIKSSNLNYGYYLNLRECSSKKIFHLTLSDPHSMYYLFRFQVLTYSQNYEATHLFRHTVVLFEQCINLVSSNRNKSTKIGFALVEYDNIGNFYESTWEMQNYIKFIDLITKWAQEQSNITVFVGPDVSTHNVGWYLHDKYNNRYVTTKELAIKLSELRYMEYNSTIKLIASTNNITIIVCIPLGVFAILFSAVVYIMRYRNKTFKITKDELYKFLKGDKNYDGLDKNAYNVPYEQNKYEIAEGDFQVELGNELGSGEFGKVTRATVTTPIGVIAVAAKTTNPQKFHSTMLNGLLSEVKLLAYIGKHVNIIELIGANTTCIKEGKVFVFLELCHMGSLEKFLRDMRLLENTKPEYVTAMHSLDIEMSYVNTNNTTRKVDKELSEDMYRWSIEICNGMAYLSSKHVVHADLASRNVLLNIRREVKICDFGLSRRMYNYTSYVKSKQEPLPWKWMAPEALQYLQFNEKTDVWAYGITLWEIYSLGSTPYAGLTWSVDFVDLLKSGLLSPTPEFEDSNMYRVMQDCWALIPDRRPSFSQLLQQLTSRTVKE